MQDVNKVILLGNLGQDPELKHTGSGKSVTNLSVATNERWKDKDGDQHERVEWHRVVVFGQPAEFAAEYLKKGSRVYIEGKLQTRKWEDKNGVEKYTTEIVASTIASQDRREEDEKPQQSARRSSGRKPPSERNKPARDDDMRDVDDLPWDDDISF